MLMAGEAAARFALAADIPIAYAIQDSPDETDLPDTLAGMFARRRTLQRSQQSTLPGPHAGLGLDLYVRVTSPLRRYLDLVAHQQLRAYVRNEPLLDGQAVLGRVGAAEAVTNNVRHAERLARQHWTLVFLLQNPNWRGQGVLVSKAGLRGRVLIPELAWEARIHLREDIPLDSVITLALQEVNLPALDAYFRIEN
jgi:exoribonuclease-2